MTLSELKLKTDLNGDFPRSFFLSGCGVFSLAARPLCMSISLAARAILPEDTTDPSEIGDTRQTRQTRPVRTPELGS